MLKKIKYKIINKTRIIFSLRPAVFRTDSPLNKITKKQTWVANTMDRGIKTDKSCRIDLGKDNSRIGNKTIPEYVKEVRWFSVNKSDIDIKIKKSNAIERNTRIVLFR
jgi:hypothetical protein